MATTDTLRSRRDTGSDLVTRKLERLLSRGRRRKDLGPLNHNVWTRICLNLKVPDRVGIRQEVHLLLAGFWNHPLNQHSMRLSQPILTVEVMFPILHPDLRLLLPLVQGLVLVVQCHLWNLSYLMRYQRRLNTPLFLFTLNLPNRKL